MATHKIGNFRFNLSKKGLAFRMGDGEIHKLAFSKNSDEPDEGYAAYRSESPDYDYGQDGQYYEDDYPENDGYADQSYDPADGDAGYDGQNYDGQGYDEGDYYAGDDGYYDENGNGDGYYDTEQQGSEPLGGLMDYVATHMWLIPVLLVVFPPLGIYLLLKFRCYQPTVRYVAAGLSAVWCLFLLWFLLWHLPSSCAGGVSDRHTPTQMELTSYAPVTPSPEPTVQVTPAPTSAIEALLNGDVTPSPTPLAGGVPSTDESGNAVTSDYVYSPQTGAYYHFDKECSKIDRNVSVTQVTLEAAKNRNQSACPLCGGGTVYYARPDGTYYHTNKTCTGMTNAVEYSKEAAEAEGKTACPTCAGGKTAEQANANKTQAQIYAESITNDRSGVKVWMTSGGKAYHLEEHCQGMSGASQKSLLKALQSGKPACEKCCAALNKIVYGTSSGKYYHTKANCGTMKNAKSVTLAAALVLGKKKCPDCVSDSLYKAESESTSTSTSSSSSGGVYVYGTPSGSYYHTNPTCGGMLNPKKVLLSEAIKAGRPACPTCCANANLTVYGASGNKYYHSYATCSGIKNAKAGSLAKAVSLGLKACPKCWSAGKAVTATDNTTASTTGGSTVNVLKPVSGGTTAKIDTITGNDDGNSGYSGVYVYASENGKYYHAKKNCSTLEDGAGRVLLEQAIDDGKAPCLNCASYASDKVYGASGSQYFHKNASCAGLSGLSNVKSGTVVKALLNGLTACPVCYKGTEDVTTVNKVNSTGKFTSGASGISVYSSTADGRYHVKYDCPNSDKNPVRCTLETALNYSKTACPVCSSSAKRTVYGSANGRYFHYSSSCAGSGAASGQLDTALGLGLKACPNCVTNTANNSKIDVGLIVNTTPSPEDTSGHQYKPGTSGIKVYGSVGDKFYHTSSSCAKVKGKPTFVTLEAALNYGLTGCENCAAAASKKVYGVASTMTFHYSSSCAGSGNIPGTLDEALAYGMTACRVCVQQNDLAGANDTKTDNTPAKDVNSAGANTKVYIDLTGNTNVFTYHKASSCKSSGMSGGTAVTLKYALEHGASPCTKCNPPTTVAGN